MNDDEDGELCWWCQKEIGRHINRPGQSRAIVVIHERWDEIDNIVRPTCSTRCARRALGLEAHAERDEQAGFFGERQR